MKAAADTFQLLCKQRKIQWLTYNKSQVIFSYWNNVEVFLKKNIFFLKIFDLKKEYLKKILIVYENFYAALYLHLYCLIYY